MTDSILLTAALAYAARQWPVFPCVARDKRPLIGRGFHAASADGAEVRAWWARWPQANIGVPTGLAETFDVLDVDGELGRGTLAELEGRHGPLPAGPRQRTGRPDGGLHVLFRGRTLPTSVEKLPGLDTRGMKAGGGAGGYIVIAPSVHSSGRAYELIDIELPLPSPPLWLNQALGNQATGDGQRLQLVPPPPTMQLVPVIPEDARALLMMMEIPLEPIGQGQRNDRLMRIGASLRSRGAGFIDIAQTLDAANRTLCRPPLDASEVTKIAASTAQMGISLGYRQAEERERLGDEAELAVERARLGEQRARLAVSTAEAKAERQRREAAVRAREEASAAATAAEASTAASTGNLDLARSLLQRELGGLRIQRVIQVGRDAARYYLQLDGDSEDVFVGTTLLSLEKLADHVAKARGHLGFADLRRKRWPAVRQALMALVELRRDEAMERRGQTREWLRHIVEVDLEGRPGGKNIENVSRSLHFIDGDMLNVSAKTLAGKLRGDGIQIPLDDLVARLREAGCTPAGKSGIVHVRARGRQVGARYHQIALPGLSLVTDANDQEVK